MSHPTWVRGLKLNNTISTVAAVVSHPTWVRGLKLICDNAVFIHCMSHPTWVRGLKRVRSPILAYPSLVAPYVGAWIETKYKIIRK